MNSDWWLQIKLAEQIKKDYLETVRRGGQLNRKEQMLLIIQLSIPAIMAQLSSVIMQYIDASMVGRLGAEASASIGLMSSTTWLMGGLCNAAAIGFTVQVAHKMTADAVAADAKKEARIKAAEEEAFQFEPAGATSGAAASKTYDLDADETYDFTDFVHIISRLRSPEGCPWDRAQTHQTLKKYLLEETQEAADAIDHKDDANFCEELGDVLLQIVLNAQVAKERGAFTIEDVIQGISEKMVRRHPWVFGDMHVDSPEEGEKLWEEIKKKEKNNKE